MGKLNPWDSALAPEPLREVTLSFTNPKWTLRLRALDELDEYAWRDKTEEYKRLYIDGPDGKPPLQLVTPDGRRVTATSALLATLAAVECMQVAEQDADRYGLMDFVGIALRLKPHWKRIEAAVNDLWNDDPGNLGESAATG